MRLIRFETPDGRTLCGTPIDDSTAAVLPSDALGDRTPTGEIAPIGRLLAAGRAANIFCIGLNYRAHAKETGAPIPDQAGGVHEAHHDDQRPRATRSSCPTPASTARRWTTRPSSPSSSAARARTSQSERALEHVLGYTCANDVSARRWQKHGGGGQWIRGKSFDSFCPIGPVLVTADEIPDPQALEISCSAERPADAAGQHQRYDLQRRRADRFLSRDTTLLPGTLILTGTPPGVGFARKPPVFLADGDRVGSRSTASEHSRIRCWTHPDRLRAPDLGLRRFLSHLSSADVS